MRDVLVAATRLPPVETLVPVHTSPRAVTISLPTATEEALGLGCARCGSALRLELTRVGIEQGQSFLRSHTACLASSWDN